MTIEEPVPLAQLIAWKDEWAARLALTHWCIKCAYVTQPRDLSNHAAAAEVWPNYEAERATIKYTLMLPEELDTAVEFWYEMTTVHELLHLILNPVLPGSTTQSEFQETLHERAIHRIAHALVKLKYEQSGKATENS